MNEAVVTAIAGAVAGSLVMWLAGWIRPLLAAHVKVSSPVERKVSRIQSVQRWHGRQIEASADRQAAQAQANIMLATAVKSGDKDMVDKAIDLLSAAEQRYLNFLESSRSMFDEDDEEGKG